MKRLATDRSRTECYQHCKRERFLTYHEGPERLGIVPIKKPLPLAVGGSTHVGLAVLIEAGQAAVTKYGSVEKVPPSLWREIEETAVAAALADFSQFRDSMETGEAPPAPADNALTSIRPDGTIPSWTQE